MKNILLLIITTLILFSCKITSPTDEKDPNDSIPKKDTVVVDTFRYGGIKYIYDIDSVPEINLTIKTTEWNKFLSYFDQNPNNEEQISADIIFTKGKTKYDLKNIGFRLRGNTSRRRAEGEKGESHNPINPDWHHASFNVKFNKYIKGQKLAKAEKIILKWFKDDAMYVREIYCYDLFERFGVWTAPQSSYCRLTIKIAEDEKPAYFGVYQMIEPIEEDYLKNRAGKFADTNGNLWKANWGADFVNTDRSRMGLENITLTSTYEPVYDYKSNASNLEAAKTQLVSFMNDFNSKTGDDFKSWLTTRVDVELLLKTYAVNVICGMWDDYWNNQNNFYFYFDTAGKFYFIPFDYDNTLGTSLLMTNSGTRDVMNWGTNKRPLIKKIIDIPEYAVLYKKYLNELIDPKFDYFHYDKSSLRIRKWQNLVKDYISNDTGEDMTLIDQPASWGNCGFYRLLDTNNNYFKIRASNIPQ